MDIFELGDRKTHEKMYCLEEIRFVVCIESVRYLRVFHGLQHQHEFAVPGGI